MAIRGAEGLTEEQLNFELQRGGKFVLFEYCVSILIVTFKRSSGIFFVRAGEGTAGKSLPYSLISLVAGWWGIPWGPIHTIGSLVTNLRGGKDVTREVIAALSGDAEPRLQDLAQLRDEGLITADEYEEKRGALAVEPRLRRLEQLLQEGLITAEEYDEKRRQLIGKT